MLVTHITHRLAWTEALEEGAYRHPSLESQGFIHFSEPTEEQLVAVANASFQEERDLVLLVVDPARLTSLLRYEEYEPGSPHFPHLYGPLNLSAVVEVLDFEAGEGGRFTLPEVLR